MSLFHVDQSAAGPAHGTRYHSGEEPMEMGSSSSVCRSQAAAAAGSASVTMESTIRPSTPVDDFVMVPDAENLPSDHSSKFEKPDI